MPQALAYTFTSQAVYTLASAALLIYLLAVYVLPCYVDLFTSRVYVTKL
ncbi:MAG: hypothetical protein EOP33_05565 [Rickettsiaceae bacterium]|nr:MAG: hypothetical protein EOP33_05565 [Rickettsiaceae bacterium]